jgi:hypothetical protein
MGVVAEDLEALLAAGELPGLLGGDYVELGGEGGKIGGGEGKEGVEGVGVGVEEGVVDVLVGFGLGGVEGGLGLLEAGKGLVPPPVIPAKAGTSKRRARSGSPGGPGFRRDDGKGRRSADSA